MRLQAGIVAAGATGLLLSGLFPVLGPVHPFRVYDAPSEALRALGGDDGPALADTLDALSQVERQRDVARGLARDLHVDECVLVAAEFDVDLVALAHAGVVVLLLVDEELTAERLGRCATRGLLGVAKLRAVLLADAACARLAGVLLATRQAEEREDKEQRPHRPSVAQGGHPRNRH
jgi:hypothetical protein